MPVRERTPLLLRGVASAAAQCTSFVASRLAAALSLAALLGPAAAAAHAQGPQPAAAAPQSTGWQFVLTPYAWAVALRGDIDTERVNTHFDADFSELWDQLNFAAMVQFAARRDRFVALFDGVWADLEDEDAVVRERVHVDAQAQELILDQKVGVRVWADPYPDARDRDPADRERMALELLVGARYLRFHSHVDLRFAGILAGFSRDVQQTYDWVDALVGFRLRGDVSRRIVFVLAADAGGFGIGSASRFTWSGLAALGVRLSPRWTVSAGYKLLQVDRTQIDFWEQGPVVGLSFAF